PLDLLLICLVRNAARNHSASPLRAVAIASERVQLLSGAIEIVMFCVSR
ncbi:MAG: hypothetical protein RL268_1765, partial [Pseudomonadota bacterium]